MASQRFYPIFLYISQRKNDFTTNNNYLCTFSYLVPFETAAARYTPYSQWPGHHHLSCCNNTLDSALSLPQITDTRLLSCYPRQLPGPKMRTSLSCDPELCRQFRRRLINGRGFKVITITWVLVLYNARLSLYGDEWTERLFCLVLEHGSWSA